MLTPTNLLDVPEITAYSQQDVEGGTVIRYLQRMPGEREWQPVKLFIPQEPSPPKRRRGIEELMYRRP